MKKTYEKIFEKFNDLSENNSLPNETRANEARKIFEWALREKLEINGDDYIALNILFDDYIESFRPKGIQYGGKDLIKKLNRFSHHTTEKLSDTELNNYLKKLNLILETIFGTKNDPATQLKTLDDPEHLNKEQKEAISSLYPLTLVHAGPGTGKTHLIVHRIIQLLKDDSEKKIVGLSFTNQAANELRGKLEYEVFGTPLFDFLNNTFIGTIHAFAIDSIKSYYRDVLHESYDYEIIDQEEFNELKQEYSSDQKKISEYLDEHKLLTFEKILIEFKKLLQEDNQFRNYVTASVHEIIIDEAQDLDKYQYDIFQELYKDSDGLRLFLVGDQRQNIFDFTGASLTNLTNTFEQNEIKVYDLKKSYRCPNTILNLVNTLTFHDARNVPLTNEQKEGEPLTLKECPNKISEAKNIVQLIRGKTDQGYTLDQFVVLSPSSFYFNEIGDALNESNIPFRLYGGETFLKHQLRYILNLTRSIILRKNYSLLKLISFWGIRYNSDNKDFNDILADLTGDYHLKSIAGEKLKNTANFIKNYPGSETIQPQYILKDFIEYSRKNHIFENSIHTLFEDFLKWLRKNQLDTPEKISLFLTPTSNDKEVALFFKRSSDIRYHDTIKGEYITLSTIHSAKGKEWDVVIMPGMTNDIFPKYGAKINSEMKKFYVACTRAKEELYFYRPYNYSVQTKAGNTFFFENKPVSLFLRSQLNHMIQSASC